MRRKRASRRGRTRVLGHKVRYFSSPSVLPNVLGGNDAFAGPLGRHSRTINSRAKSRCSNAVHPCMDVCPLLRQHAPAFFLIEEDNGLTRKALAPGRGGGLGGILFPYS